MAMISTDLRPAVFLDKDGSLLNDVPYNVEPQKMEWAPGAKEAIRRLGSLGIPLVVISNQPGIALGYFKVGALGAVKARLTEMFREVGAKLSGFYFCPHFEAGSVDEYAVRCQCRKPEPGMLKRAAQEMNIDLRKSWFVGDMLSDVEAGNRAGCSTVFIDNGNETEWRVDGPLRVPHYTVSDMQECCDVLTDELASEGNHDPAADDHRFLPADVYTETGLEGRM